MQSKIIYIELTVCDYPPTHFPTAFFLSLSHRAAVKTSPQLHKKEKLTEYISLGLECMAVCQLWSASCRHVYSKLQNINILRKNLPTPLSPSRVSLSLFLIWFPHTLFLYIIIFSTLLFFSICLSLSFDRSLSSSPSCVMRNRIQTRQPMWKEGYPSKNTQTHIF